MRGLRLGSPTVLSAVLSALLGLGLTTFAPSASALARSRELVIVDDRLAALPGGAEAVSRHLAFLVKRLEKLAGWKPGSLQGKAFASYDDAAAHVRKSRPGFGILSTHDFVRLRQKHPTRVIGQSHDRQMFLGKLPRFWVVTKRDTMVTKHLHMQPDFRLATAEGDDLQWVNVIFDGLLRPATHFQYVKVANTREALEAVEQGKADLAMVPQADIQQIEVRTRRNSGDLKIVYSSPDMPPGAVVAFDKNVNPGDLKSIEAALERLCREDGEDACVGLGIYRVVPGAHEHHPDIAQKYDIYKQ
jgi:hypothetical protein